ncbi:hypothetical protein Aduo_009298 [Ancylostoma duodenale]
MRTAIGLLLVVVLVNAKFLDFFKKRTTPNPAVYCKDKDENNCKNVVKNGSCKPEDKDRCAKSCNQCCFDMYPDECKKMEQQGFCSFALAHYTVAEIKVLCGVTCKLCDS